MSQQNNTKVAVDTQISESTPTVYISTPAEEPEQEMDALKKQPKENIITQLARHTVAFVMDFMETIVVALSIFVVVYLFLVQPHEVKGNSMEPNFHNNEYILTDKITYKFREPQRGEVIIFKAPRNPDVDYIKRVIGLPGENVKVEKGKIYINGQLLDEPYLKDATSLFPGSFMQEGLPILVPEGEFFAMGDNRPHSSDSREFGPVARNLIIGRAVIRYWPIPVIGMIAQPEYMLPSASDK